MRGDNADGLEVMIRPSVVTINATILCQQTYLLAGGLFIDEGE